MDIGAFEMSFIDRLFDSLETPGPNQRWLECNGNVARKAFEEMMEERANAAAPHRAASLRPQQWNTPNG